MAIQIDANQVIHQHNCFLKKSISILKDLEVNFYSLLLYLLNIYWRKHILVKIGHLK